MAWAPLFLTCDMYFARMFLKLTCDSASVIHSPSLHSHKRSLAASQGGPCPKLFNISLCFSFTQLCPLPTGVVLPFTEPLLSQVGIHLFQMTASSFSQISPYVKPSPGTRLLGTDSNHCISLSLFPSPYACISTIVFIIMTPCCNLNAYLFSHQ